jgi:AcrR family transcriptional regulator
VAAPTKQPGALAGPAEDAVRSAGRPQLGGRDTRVDILQAARGMFAEHGFERTTMRAVAAKAGVDVALIYHHFASKDDLLTAALTVPPGAESGLRPIPAGTTNPGAAVASRILGMWENDPTLREQALAMFRTALSHEHAAQRVKDLHTSAVGALVAEIVTEDDRDLRAALIGAQLMGVVLTRYLFKTDTAVSADPAVLVAAVAPAIDHYLTGDLTHSAPIGASQHRAAHGARGPE